MSTYSGRSRVCPKAAQRREEILDAAIRCFREKGFHAASMSSIAKAFGMSAGHIYNYFDSKEDIIEAIVNRWLDNYIHTIQIRWNPDPDIHREEVQESIGQQIEDRLTCGDRALRFEIAAESFRNKKIAECIRRADRVGRKHLMEQAVACYREHGVEPPAKSGLWWLGPSSTDSCFIPAWIRSLSRRPYFRSLRISCFILRRVTGNRQTREKRKKKHKKSAS